MPATRSLSRRAIPRLRIFRSIWALVIDADKRYRDKLALQRALRDPRIACDIGLPPMADETRPDRWLR